MFRKNKIKEDSKFTNVAAGKIAKGILSIQERFADTMSATSKKWKTKQQWIFLYLVCLIPGGLSVVAVIKPFKEKISTFSKPASIHIPKLLKTDEDKIIITDNEITKLHLFKERLDSHSKTKDGKIKVEQFVKRRPGLFDSLKMVEQMYYSQKK